MTDEAVASDTKAPNASKPLVFQSPPTLASQVSPSEYAAVEGNAQTHARSLSTRAAALAGTIGGALIGLFIIGAGKANRALKIATAAVGGGIVGAFISNLPWNAKRAPIEQPPETPVAMPNIPNVPIPAPAPHPANPAASVVNTEHTGRVESSSQAVELGA